MRVTKLIRELKHLLYEDKVGAVQPGKDKVEWTPHSNLPVSEGGLQGSQRGTLNQEL